MILYIHNVLIHYTCVFNLLDLFNYYLSVSFFGYITEHLMTMKIANPHTNMTQRKNDNKWML